MLTFEDDAIATIKPIKGDKNIEIKNAPQKPMLFPDPIMPTSNEKTNQSAKIMI